MIDSNKAIQAYKTLKDDIMALYDALHDYQSAEDCDLTHSYELVLEAQQNLFNNLKITGLTND